MATEKELKAVETAADTVEKAAEDNDYIVKLNKPYKFDDKEYSEIDLRGLEKLTIKDATTAQGDLFNQQEVACSMLCETTTAFAREMAAKATKLPVEFFKFMPRGMAKRVFAVVRAHMKIENNSDNHTMILKKPYLFNGKQYTEIDLSGIANLTCMNESEAENRLAREGFVITENSFNYLYACIIASMATGQPEEFFTGLPLGELLNLKNAANDDSFFE